MLFLFVCSLVLALASSLPFPAHSSENGLSDIYMGTCRNNEQERRMFHEKVDQMQQCYGDLIDWNKAVNNDISEIISTTAASASTENSCSTLTTYLDCLSDFLTSVQHCFGPTQQSFMHATINGTRAMFDVVCPVIQEAKANIGQAAISAKCFKDVIPDMYACRGNKNEERKLLKDDNLALGLLMASYDEQTCRALHEGWSCIKTALDKCQASSLINAIEEGVEKFAEATPCKEIMESTTYSPM